MQNTHSGGRSMPDVHEELFGATTVHGGTSETVN